MKDSTEVNEDGLIECRASVRDKRITKGEETGHAFTLAGSSGSGWSQERKLVSACSDMLWRAAPTFSRSKKSL